MKSRKRSWTREEVILALDLYLEKGGIAPESDCAELSAFLRALPIEAHLADDPTFRNVSGVRNKLYNLQWLDTHGAQGRENAGLATERAWEEFGPNQDAVRRAAVAIRTAYADLQQREQEDAAPDEYESDEGAIVVRTHRTRERDPNLVRRKKEKALSESGKLACEACGFDSEATYGIPGIIECHHLKPVSSLTPGERTRLADLRLVCPTCHRVVHSQNPWLTWQQLTDLVEPAHESANE